MALDIVVTTSRWKNDPASREFFDNIREKQNELNIDEGILYYDFPSYSDYEASLFRPDLLLFTKFHGFVAIRFFDLSLFQKSVSDAHEIDLALDEFASNLHSRLVRSRILRQDRTTTVVKINTVIMEANSDGEIDLTNQNLSSYVCKSYEAFEELLDEISGNPITDIQADEVRSVVEGAKALSRPQQRIVASDKEQPLAAAMAKLESEISNFDQKQRRIALIDVGGPARIRGLAGCGKTVILAMKAANLHRDDPNAKILLTFFTKSLRNTIKTLVTKFYRLYSDSDPNWKKLHIRHGWGGSTIPGVYSEACVRAEHNRLTFPQAQRVAAKTSGMTAFAAACEDLLKNTRNMEYYDHVLIDEGQDFPDSFYRLAYRLTKGPRDFKRIIWAYDELQDIMNVKIRQPQELFGCDENGVSYVDLDRSSKHVPLGGTNDAVLSKTYRNQGTILVTAHAMGFGVYGGIVQLLESREHWEDVGYDVLSKNDLNTGDQVLVERPARNSPVKIDTVDKFKLVDWFIGNSISNEVEWAVQMIEKFVKSGLSPEEILVIAMDDRYAKSYLKNISSGLSNLGISSNNIIADPYNEPPFVIQDRVTLSTVYRAKGNEAAAVFAVGIDAVRTASRSGRNKIFTAFTRTKAWLRVSGIGQNAQSIIDELEEAITNSPKIQFVMPDMKEVETIQRGFSKKASLAKKARDNFIKSLRDAGLSEDEIEAELNSIANNE